MKRRTTLLCIIFLLFLVACDLKPEGPPELSNEEHAIISAVLDSIMHQGHPLGTIDVYDLTTTSTNCPSLHIAFEQDSIGSDSLLNNYYNANRIRYALNMDKLPNYVMLKDTEEAEPYSGYTAFTRPGISNDGLLAIVEYSSMSAPLAGCGMAALLEKEDGEWQIVWVEMIWIS
ncbi:MAG: hypothetical protein DRP93_05040 [Candidatus Neomarinimicrobiota bacterium]|nr:MAG: hypothetical protein DRP93_05040 [Candidatus Neomarinimicrobiota bacterium]